MYLLSPFQPLLCTTAKLIFLKHGSTVLLRTFQWFPFVCRIKSNVSVSPFPVTLCTILLNLSCNLANVSSHYSLGCTFVLAYILCFCWEYLDFLYFKGCLQSSEEISLLCVGFPYTFPFCTVTASDFFLLLWHLWLCLFVCDIKCPHFSVFSAPWGQNLYFTLFVSPTISRTMLGMQ